MERAIVRLRTASATRKAIYATVRGKAIRRLLLPRTEQHVYFSVDHDDELVIYQRQSFLPVRSS